MKRGLLATLVGVAMCLAGVGTASAEDAAGYGKTGGLGIGGAVSTRGATGLSAYYVPAARIGIQGVLHFENSSGDGPSSSEFGLTVNGLYSLISDGGFELPAFVGFDFTTVSQDNPAGGSDSQNGIAFQLGVQPAWWPAPSVSFHLALALLIDLNASGPGVGFGGSPGEGSAFALPGSPEIVGAAGFTFWIQ
jgi:hypothetical protein